MGFILSALKIIFVLGFLIFIHEGGHFLVAKACKVKVKEFSIGFGPKIYVKQGNETKYTIRLIPLGGFVDMLGESERRDEPGSFSTAKIWKRFAIVLAGATVNIIFGLVVYFSWVAVDFNQVSTIVDEISSEYNENLKELMLGDEIIKINGKSVHTKNELDEVLSNIENENLTVIVKRAGEKKEVNVKASKIINKYVGIYYSTSEDNNTEIQYVQENSPAEKAGLKKGDKILRINGIDTLNPNEVSENINANDLIFTIDRHGENKEIKVTAEDVPRYIFGVILKQADSNFKNRIYYGYWQTVNYLKAIGENLKMLFTGKVKADQMMGPIGISETIAKTKGISEYIYFLSIISLSLGVSNLLPIPALDGGRLVLLIIEAIRRKPLDEALEIKIQMLGFSFLIIISIYIAFNDIIRISG